MIEEFSVEGCYFDQIVRSPVRVREELRNPYGLAFFCPTCGNVWAKFWVTAGGRDEPFMVHIRKCRADGDGSLWEPFFDDEITDLYPPSIVQREFFLELEKAGKEAGNVEPASKEAA